MNKVEAEAEIVRQVKDIDAIREGNRTDKVLAISKIDDKIKELKKITGQRKIVGRMGI